MDNFQKNIEEAYDDSIDIRIGIHFGEVIVGTVGHGDDKKLTVIGDTVNIASRIEAANKEAETRLLISESAYKEVEDLVEVEDFVRLKLRGSSKRTTLYEISEIKPDVIKKYETTEEKLIDGKMVEDASYFGVIFRRKTKV